MSGRPGTHTKDRSRQPTASPNTRSSWVWSACTHRVLKSEARPATTPRNAGGRHPLSTLHDSLHEEVGSKFGLERGQRGSQRKHEAVSVDEATRRYAKDRTAPIEARERELATSERELDQRKRNLTAAIDKVERTAQPCERPARGGRRRR